jgi:hypothetical protein
MLLPVSSTPTIAFRFGYTVGPRSNDVSRLNPFALAGYGLVVALSTLRAYPETGVWMVCRSCGGSGTGRFWTVVADGQSGHCSRAVHQGMAMPAAAWAAAWQRRCADPAVCRAEL